MAHRKAIVGLSLLSALAVLALAAPSAPATFTTAGECIKGEGAVDFKNAHCSEEVPQGTGSYGHVLFANGVKNNVVLTNTGTALPFYFTLEGTLAGVVTKIECKQVSGTSSVTNETGGKVSFGTTEIQLSNCEMRAPAKCAGKGVLIPKLVTELTGVHNLQLSKATKEYPTGEKLSFHEENAAGTEMGLKFMTPVGAKALTEIELTCPLEAKVPLKGFVFATPFLPAGGASETSGATASFTGSSSIAGLTFGGAPATLEGALTFEKEKGKPLIVTTSDSP